MSEFPPLSDLHDDEFVVDSPAELLWRQIHPSWLDDGIPSSQGFRPGSNDEGQLSTRRSSLMTAEEAFIDHGKLGLATVGTWAFSVQEVSDTQLRVIDDSALPNSPRAHAYVDFRNVSTKQAKRMGALLSAAAKSRGRIYPSRD